MTLVARGGDDAGDAAAVLMRALALDLGTKRIGVALSDATATLASPLTTLARSDDLVGAVAALVHEHAVVVVVVGLPLNMNGSKGPAAQSAMAEAALLRRALDVPVELADERLTTVTADRALQGSARRGASRRVPARRQVVDQAAAAVLLQSWLDGPGGRRLRGAE